MKWANLDMENDEIMHFLRYFQQKIFMQKLHQKNNQLKIFSS